MSNVISREPSSHCELATPYSPMSYRCLLIDKATHVGYTLLGYTYMQTRMHMDTDWSSSMLTEWPDDRMCSIGSSKRQTTPHSNRWRWLKRTERERERGGFQTSVLIWPLFSDTSMHILWPCKGCEPVVMDGNFT